MADAKVSDQTPTRWCFAHRSDDFLSDEQCMRSAWFPSDGGPVEYSPCDIDLMVRVPVSANDTLYRLHDECGGTHERLTNCGTFDYCDNDSPCVVPVYPKEET